MKKELIYIEPKGDGNVPYLSEIIPEIPTNTILNKKLTGLGATFLEIKSKHNSIIIEPNVPVIKGKCKSSEHKVDNLFGVYKGVSEDDIIDYIENSVEKGLFLKVLTTPESFPRVHKALDSCDIEIRFECFLLYDEVHKSAKDVDFRRNITLPMDVFFECENKALVSATPIELTDPRFLEQDFQNLELAPSFNYDKQILLCITNNTLQSVKECLKGLKGNVFIFCNSTDMIYNLIMQLGLIEESSVFCSTESVSKLKNYKDIKFTSAYDMWDKTHMKRFNWLTSRFYNAVDIKLDTQPDVLLLSNSYYAEWTLMDPATDVVQAVGRFRNGVSSIEHIASINSNLQSRCREEVKGYIRGLETAHNMLVQYHDTATDTNMRTAWDEIVKSSPFNRFLDENHHKDFFLVDNYVDDEIVKSFYSSKEKLMSAYEKTGYFQVKVKEDYYTIGDYERLKRDNPKLLKKERRQNIVEQLEMLGPCETEMEMDYLNELRQSDSFIVEAYEIVGKVVIEKLNYNEKLIREAVIMKKYNEKVTGNEAIQLIKNSFKENKWYPDKYIKSEINRIFQVVGVKYPKAVTSYTIGDFFEFKQKNTKKEKGKLLGKARF